MNRIIIWFLLLVIFPFGYSSDFNFKPLRRKITYKEEFFRLYNQWLYSDLDSISRNIYFLELAYIAPFDHPIRALIPITNEMQYERYKNLLMMHITLMLAQEYINYGYSFMKENIYFFNEEFKKEYLEGYEIAEFYFKSARNYWKEAVKYAYLADSIKGYKTELHYFEDEVWKIKENELDYDKVIDNLLYRIERNRKKLSE